MSRETVFIFFSFHGACSLLPAFVTQNTPSPVEMSDEASLAEFTCIVFRFLALLLALMRFEINTLKSNAMKSF